MKLCHEQFSYFFHWYVNPAQNNVLLVFFVCLFASYKIVPFEREYEKKIKRKEKTALRQRVLNYRRFTQSLNRPHSWIFHQQLSPKAVFDIHLYSMDVPLTHIRRSKWTERFF